MALKLRNQKQVFVSNSDHSWLEKRKKKSRVPIVGSVADAIQLLREADQKKAKAEANASSPA